MTCSNTFRRGLRPGRGGPLGGVVRFDSICCLPWHAQGLPFGLKHRAAPAFLWIALRRESPSQPCQTGSAVSAEARADGGPLATGAAITRSWGI